MAAVPGRYSVVLGRRPACCGAAADPRRALAFFQLALDARPASDRDLATVALLRRAIAADVASAPPVRAALGRLAAAPP